MRLLRIVVIGVVLACAVPSGAQTTAFTIEAVTSAPFPTNLTASATGERIAWTLNAQGRRNVWVAEGPAFVARQLTAYEVDDGQELNALQISADGAWVVYQRGGDFGSNWDDADPVNPTGAVIPTAVSLWAVPFAGGAPVSLGEGVNPVLSPRSDIVVFERGRQLWSVPIGGGAPATKLFDQRGAAGDARFSPDGARLAFVSSRGDHAFIAVYTNASTPIRYLAPTTSRDGSPRWSPDGSSIAFVRRAGAGGPPPSSLEPVPTPWSIWIADVATGQARQRWTSGSGPRDTVPFTHGGTNLHWTGTGRLVFLSYQDGWPHLYSMTTSGTDAPLLLTPGDHMAEHVTIAPDGRHALYAGNLGTTAGDIDRRHVVRVPVDGAAPEVLTPGTGLESSPVVLATGRVVALGGGAQQPPMPFAFDTVEPAVRPNGAGRIAIGASAVPATFPAKQLVVPTPVTFTASDGGRVYGQLFTPSGGGDAKRPAIVYIHGGPMRQMLLGWHYGDYYWNAYALNQYLASRGFVVLSVNYRLGIGYGFDFHRPSKAGAAGASEYLDIKAAGEWLRARADVDGSRIGVYGGSYGGYLTALALGRDSSIFAAGVDIHGVHDFTSDGGGRIGAGAWRYERAASLVEAFAQTAWESSPVASVATWRSPVLLIHADDDRNVRFSQTVDLLQRLRAKGVETEELVIVDDTHHFLRYANQLRVNQAIAGYLEKKLVTKP